MRRSLTRAASSYPESDVIRYHADRAVSSAGQSASFTPRRSGVRAPHRPPPGPTTRCCYDAARQPPSARSTTRMPLWLIILLIAVAVIAVFLIFTYNGLVRLRNMVDEAWNQISVQLKRRHDLIPNLVNAVKGYMDFEQE